MTRGASGSAVLMAIAATLLLLAACVAAGLNLGGLHADVLALAGFASWAAAGIA